MNSFYYYNPTKLVFGTDSVSKTVDNFQNYKKIALVHYGVDILKKAGLSGLYDQVVELLKKNNKEFVEISGVKPNPSIDLVREGVNMCKEQNIDFILAIGGGSVIDSAKAIAAGVFYENDPWDLFTQDINLEKALPIGVILTIPATGSESSSATIIDNEETQQKLGLESDLLRPQFAILNPELTLTLPSRHTFAGIVDILSHVIERYFTNTTNVHLTDHLCEGAMKSVIDNAYILLDEPNNLAARSEIMVSGTIAHSGILGLGREEDWASHRIGHELTAIYGTTHGVTLSIIMPAWMRYVYKNNIMRFVRFAQKVFNIENTTLTNEEIALLGIEKFEQFLKDVHMPTTLKEENIPYDEFNKMAEKCCGSNTVGRFTKLSQEDVIKIFELAK
ncbi:iron-containing alcohol dehydrogenase [Mycoplasmatota bacterium]|nr:iron-containing alcohol dehydrogenase [Mycoplasmatota bacterium]